MNINWYPGHMKKHMDMTKSNLRIFDVFIFVLDCRAPLSSFHPDLKNMLQNKLIIFIISKEDLADDKVSKLWKEYFKKNYPKNHIFTNLKRKNLWKILKPMIIKYAEAINKKIFFGKIMIVGVPNVGKSTLINNLINKKSVSISNKPGHTQSFKNVKIDNQFELCDTPGLLWPKFSDNNLGFNLAMINAIKIDVLPIEDILYMAFEFLFYNYHNNFVKFLVKNNLKINQDKFLNYDKKIHLNLIKELTENKKWFIKNNVLDLKRSQNFYIRKLQNGEMFNISWEKPAS